MWKFKKELFFCIEGKRNMCIGGDYKQGGRKVCVSQNERGGREIEGKKVCEREGV